MSSEEKQDVCVCEREREREKMADGHGGRTVCRVRSVVLASGSRDGSLGRTQEWNAEGTDLERPPGLVPPGAARRRRPARRHDAEPLLAVLGDALVAVVAALVVRDVRVGIHALAVVALGRRLPRAPAAARVAVAAALRRGKEVEPRVPKVVHVRLLSGRARLRVRPLCPVVVVGQRPRLPDGARGR
ncbi:hypothetical protein VTK73DRAFT_4531 [Phialemonium thermophilum]|uniref:Uncharacterized protein n=1 Tax=Phialemonium thermophilum TaxID=223376 RepID=A0ABR3V7T2_9PEZI